MLTSPKSLILSLMLGFRATGEASMSVRELLSACALFDFNESSVRVTLVRAVATGFLTSPKRGYYALGPSARPLASEVERWRDVQSRVIPWSGDWIGVHVGAQGRSDRSVLRSRERTLQMLGFSELERGLYIRPDNFEGSADALRSRVTALLPKGAPLGTIFVLSNFSPDDSRRACALWDTDSINASYRDLTAELKNWLKDAASIGLDQAARESFELGNEAIRRVVFDPLLPPPLVNSALRSQFITAVERFDSAGWLIWKRFLAEAKASA